MKKIVLFIVVVFVSILSFAQTNKYTSLPNIIPSNSKAFEFIKYGENPVSKYTGIPKISIPIYTINAKGLDVPVLLSYHSNGFRVNEEAGWTGLGWTLRDGGSITQFVNGTDDFGFYKNRQIPDLVLMGGDGNPILSAMGLCSPFSIFGQDGSNVSNSNGQGWIGPNGVNMTQDNFFPSTYSQGYLDIEPDIFKFNFLDYSGEFILDWESGNFVCLSDSNIKIESTNSNNTPIEFVIIVPDGHKFKFTVKEKGEYFLHISESEEFGGGFTGPDLKLFPEKSFRTFQLTEIMTNKGDQIIYNYSPSNEIIGYPSVSKQMYYYDPLPGFGNLPIGIRQFDVTQSVVVTKQVNSYLESIIFSEGRINFFTSNRLDINEAQKLDHIEVVNNSQEIIKTYNFNYEYFIGHTLGTDLDNYLNNYSINKTNNELTHRLKLTSLSELGKPPYFFEYNETVPLPKKTSLATDYWGYYNGFLTNESTFPNLYRFNVQGDNPLLVKYKDNNKSSSYSHTLSAVLKKMIYPTGGYSEFEFELNSFNNYLAPAIDCCPNEIINVDSNPTTQSPSDIELIILNGDSTNFKASGILSTRGCNFNDMYDKTYIEMHLFKPSLISAIENTNYSGMYELAVRGLIPGSSNFNESNYDLYVDEVVSIRMRYDDPEEVIYSNLNYNFNRGVLLVRAYGGCGTYNGTVNSSQATVTLKYSDYGAHDAVSFGAGLRISKISNFNNSNLPTSKKLYSYQNGKLMTPLIYAKRSQFNSLTYFPTTPSNYITRVFKGTKFSLSSSSITGSSTNASGSFVGYSKVTDENMVVNLVSEVNSISQGNLNGKTITHYSNNPDQSNAGSGDAIFHTVPINFPPIKNSFDNGLVLKEEYYNKTDIIPIKQIINSYVYPTNNNNCFYGVKFSATGIYNTPGSFGPGIYNTFSVGGYPIKYHEKSLLSISKEINFFQNNSITATNHYVYDIRNQLSSITLSDYNGDLLISNFKYPYDFLGNYPYNLMVNSNTISPVIERNSIRNSITSSTHKTSYFKYFVNFNPVFLPETIQTLKGEPTATNTLEPRIIYHDYDDFGNPLEVSKTDGTHIVYIWGYNHSQPIAKIENATYAQLLSHVPNLQTKSNTDTHRSVDTIAENGVKIYANDSEGNLREALDGLRDTLPNALVTTYTYDPLIGVTSMTDPRGSTIYYNYDAFNRLKHVKDQDGNILSKNDYNYKN